MQLHVRSGYRQRAHFDKFRSSHDFLSKLLSYPLKVSFLSFAKCTQTKKSFLLQPLGHQRQPRLGGRIFRFWRTNPMASHLRRLPLKVTKVNRLTSVSLLLSDRSWNRFDLLMWSVNRPFSNFCSEKDCWLPKALVHISKKSCSAFLILLTAFRKVMSLYFINVNLIDICLHLLPDFFFRSLYYYLLL